MIKVKKSQLNDSEIAEIMAIGRDDNKAAWKELVRQIHTTPGCTTNDLRKNPRLKNSNINDLASKFNQTLFIKGIQYQIVTDAPARAPGINTDSNPADRLHWHLARVVEAEAENVKANINFPG